MRHPRSQRNSETVTFEQRNAWFLGHHPRHKGRKPDIYRLLNARKRGRRIKAPEVLARWQSIGPSNIGGRATCLAVPPQDPDRVYLGTAGGGVWFSDRRGERWRQIWPDKWELNIGAVAIDPTDPEVIYCGTGEANGSRDSYPGVGLYRSTDAGRRWRLIATPESNGMPRRIGVVAIDPFDSRHIRVGGLAQSGDEWPMLVSRNRGTAWEKAPFLLPNESCHSVVFHPGRRGVLFAAIQSGRGGSRTGIWRSLDGGDSWHQLSGGLPAPERFRRISLAIAPSRPDLIYAVAATKTGNSDPRPCVFRSDNMGDRWRRISKHNYADEDQMEYNSCIAVHPEDPEFVIWGGSDLYLSRNGGGSWKKVTHWDHDRGAPSYAHADHHALIMPPRTNGRIYSANDGGVDTSEDGATWKNRSNGLATTMFYDIDVARTSARRYGGGAQDNGTLITDNGRPDGFQEILPFDGGWMVYDPDDSERLLASEQRMSLYSIRHRKRRASEFHGITTEETQAVWMAFIAPDYNDARIAYTASTRVWKTANKGFSWKPVSDVLDGSPVSAIEVATAASRYVYVGTRQGGFYRSESAAEKWSRRLGARDLPAREITRIESHPEDPKLVIATFAQNQDEKATSSHVFCSSDGGQHWKDIDRGRLPNVKHTSAAFRADKPSELYVANHVGVFLTTNLGKTWRNVTGNLPNAIVVDLVYHEKSRTLTAATYGRSLWRMRLR